ncbi:MAG: hypothetical protein V8K32_10870 [Candidatus Electrothrix gigas]
MSKQTEVHGDNFGNKGTQAVAKDKGNVHINGPPWEEYTRAIREETRAAMKAELLAEHVKELEECFRKIRAGEPVDQATYVQIEILLKRNKR